MLNPSHDQPHFFGTHAKIILSEWQALHSLIIKRTALIKESITPTKEEISLAKTPLTDRQLHDALNGPYQSFFKQFMSAYALLVRYRLELNVVEHDIFKENRPRLTQIQEISKKRLTKVSITDLENIQEKLDELIVEHDEQWQSQITQWQQQLLEHMENALSSLSEIEIKEFNDLEPLSELLDRFKLLQISHPKTKGVEMNFMSYFKLKSDLTIHSALSRQHKSNEQAAIDKILKLLKATLDQISKDENEIIANQQAAINSVMAPLKAN